MTRLQSLYGIVGTTFTSSHRFGKCDAYRSFGVEKKIFLFCHVTSREHMIKGTRDLLVGAPYPKLPPYQVWLMVKAFVERDTECF